MVGPEAHGGSAVNSGVTKPMSPPQLETRKAGQVSATPEKRSNVKLAPRPLLLLTVFRTALAEDLQNLLHGRPVRRASLIGFPSICCCHAHCTRLILTWG